MVEDRRRFTREDWINAAKTIFIDRGVEDVKVDVIAKRLNVTRGSFYWHFANRQALLDAVLADWIERNMAGLAKLRAASPSGVPTLADCIRFWLGIEEEALTFEMSVRMWARKSRPVAEQLLIVDLAWIDLIAEVFRNRGDVDPIAIARARVLYFHQLGYHTLDMRENRDTRLAMIPLYNRILTGRDIDPEIDAMVAELQARPDASARRKRAPRRIAK